MVVFETLWFGGHRPHTKALKSQLGGRTAADRPWSITGMIFTGVEQAMRDLHKYFPEERHLRRIKVIIITGHGDSADNTFMFQNPSEPNIDYKINFKDLAYHFLPLTSWGLFLSSCDSMKSPGKLKKKATQYFQLS